MSRDPIEVAVASRYMAAGKVAPVRGQPFSLLVSDDILARLGPVAAEDLARRMIAAEAASAGIRIDQIRTSGNTIAPDGGIDFVVRAAPKDSDTGLIKKGHTAYRVKSGAFVPSRDIARMLFKKGGRLKDGMRECLDSNGTLVVILTGRGVPGTDTREPKVGSQGRCPTGAQSMQDRR